MGWISRTVLGWATSAQEREIKDFVAKLSYMDSDEIGIMVAVAADFRNHFWATERQDLAQPSVVLCADPRTTYHLSKSVNILQKGGNFMPAAAIIVWVHTLRAMTEIGLRPYGRAMWKELQRGMPHAQEAAQYYRVAFGKTLNIDGYEDIPSGMGPQV